MWTEGVQGLDMSWPIKGWENSRCSAAVGLQSVQYLSCQVPWPASVRTRHLKIWTIRSKHPDVGMSLPIYGTNFQGKEHEEIPAILVFTRAKTGFDAFWCWKSVLNLWSFWIETRQGTSWNGCGSTSSNTPQQLGCPAVDLRCQRAWTCHACGSMIHKKCQY